MAIRFSLESVLKLRDDLSGPVTNIFERIEDLGDRAARRVGKALRARFADADIYKRVGHLLKRGAQGVAANAAVAAFGIDQVLERMARTARMGEAIGIGPGFLAGLESAAAQKGIENVEDVSRSIEEFGLRLSELRAKNPSGELFGKLQDIGATRFIKQLRDAESSTDALVLALSALASVTDPANRTSLADALFGGSDAALDLRRIARSREELGQFIDAARASAKTTDEQFHAAQRYSEAKARLLVRVRDVAFALASRLAPAFEGVASRAGAWIDANRELIDQRLAAFAEGVAARVRQLMSLDWGRWFAQAAALARDAIDALIAFGKVARGIAAAAIATARKLGKWLRQLGVDGMTLARVGQLVFAAWAASKIARLGQSIASMARRTADFVRGVRDLPRAAGRARAAMLAAFGAGTVGLVVSLAASIWDVVAGLRSAKDEARLAFDFDKAGEKQQAVLKDVKRSIDAIERGKRAAAQRFIHGDKSAQGELERADVRLAELRRQQRDIERRIRTAELLGQIEQGDATTEDEQRRKTGLQQVLGGEQDTPEVKELRAFIDRTLEHEGHGQTQERFPGQPVGENSFLDELIDSRVAIQREAEKTAAAENRAAERRAQAASPSGPPSALPPGTPPAPSAELRQDMLRQILADNRAIAGEVKSLVGQVTQLVAAQRTRANLGVR